MTASPMILSSKISGADPEILKGGGGGREKNKKKEKEGGRQ